MTTKIFYRGFFTACILALPLSFAHAKNIVQSGQIEANTICHDGANRGATIGLKLSKYNFKHDVQVSPGSSRYRKELKSFATIGAKTYYTGTTCHDLKDYGHAIYQGNRFYVWTVVGAAEKLCESFNIRYVGNRKEVWVQTGGTTVFNVNCVAKDGI